LRLLLIFERVIVDRRRRREVMTRDPLSSEGILKDLQEIYLMALGKRQYSVAFKIKALLGREVGLFALRSKAANKNKLSVDTLSDEDITHLIETLEAKFNIMQQ
jgi:hypothetical protein